MKKDRKADEFICTECAFAFKSLSPWGEEKNPRKYCPKCGDHFFVRVLKPENQIEKELVKTGTRWTNKELEYLDRLIAGEFKAYHLVYKLKRSERSIVNRRKRRLKELGIDSDLRLDWTDEENELVDQWLRRDLSLNDVVFQTGREYNSVKSYGYRRRRKLINQGVTL